MRVMEADRVEVERGDMLLLRTGFAEVVLSMQREPDETVLHHSCSALDGRDDKLLQWLTDSGVAALIADNYAVERYPRARAGRRRPPSAAAAAPPLPVQAGPAAGRAVVPARLAQWLRAHGRSRFLLTAPPLRLPGAVGSPTTPVATV